MKRVAIIADSHFCEDSRFAECLRIHAWIADDMERRGVDLVVHTGDVYERKSAPRERTAVAGFFQRVADNAPVVIVRGNHDVLGDLEILGRLERRHPILVEEKAAVHVVGGIAVAAVAWPRKAELLAVLGQVSHQEGEQAAGDALRNVLRGLGQELDEYDGARLLAMHAMVRGSMTSTGQPLVGCDMELGIEDLALARADFYALGHVHKGQDWLAGVAPIVYPGSPRRTAFGETERKGYVIVAIDDSVILVEPGQTHPATWEFIETPSTPMVDVHAEWSEPLGQDDDGPARLWRDPGDVTRVAGAEVRLRYAVDSSERDAAKVAVAAYRDELLAAGAVSVKVEEEVIAKTRARAPQIAAAPTLLGKLEALWASRGDDITDARRARLATKLTQIEEETLNAA